MRPFVTVSQVSDVLFIFFSLCSVFQIGRFLLFFFEFTAAFLFSALCRVHSLSFVLFFSFSFDFHIKNLCLVFLSILHLLILSISSFVSSIFIIANLLFSRPLLILLCLFTAA